MASQARTGLATGGKPYSNLDLREVVRPARSRPYRPWEWLGEGTAAAGGMTAVEASNAQVQRRWLNNARQIGQTAFIAAVKGRTGRAARRTPAPNTPAWAMTTRRALVCMTRSMVKQATHVQDGRRREILHVADDQSAITGSLSSWRSRIR